MGSEALKLITDAKVRDAFPVLQEVLYLNVGTYGIMPAPTLDQFQAIQAEFEGRGVASDGAFGRKTEETRGRIAAMIGAQPEEISFTRNATDGINLVLAGIDWQPGDEVITLDQEHEAMVHPLLYLHKTRGIEFKLLETSPNAEVMLEQLERAVTPRTRLVAMSMVTCETGTRLPARAISEWAARRGLFCLLDGAQVSGAVPVKMGEIGCDFYASNGHKWLSGPKGSGFFYCRKERLSGLSPAHVGAGSLERADIPKRIGEPFLTGQRFEFGTRAWAISAGLGASLDWFDRLGWENVYAHIAALSGYLKDCIQQRPYLRLLTPVDYGESSGLVTFVIEGHVAQEVSKALRENWKAYVRVIPHYNAIRISTAHFNQTGEMDRLMEAIDSIHHVS
jgi:selenocysteine lyase/cysteine desulfurase